MNKFVNIVINKKIYLITYVFFACFTLLPNILTSNIFKNFKCAYKPDNTIQDISDFPAITIQVFNNSFVKNKYAKLTSEASFGIYIAFDNINNNIIYKIIQEEKNPSIINVDETIEKIKKLIEEEKDQIKNYLQNIIDFENLQYYINLLDNHFSDFGIPKVGIIGTYLNDKTYLKYKNIVKKNKTNIKINLEKDLEGWKPNKTLEKLQSEIGIFKKRLQITDIDGQEINNLVKSMQEFVRKHPFFEKNKSRYNRYDSLEMSFDLFNNSIDNSAGYDMPCQYHPHHYYDHIHNNCFYCDNNCNDIRKEKLYIHEIAYIRTALLKKTYTKYIEAKCNTTVSAYYYSPPKKEQYASKDRRKALKEKINSARHLLRKIAERKEILKKDGGEKAKDKVNELTTKVINIIKEQKERINNEVDKVCNEIQKIFK